jgi:hypothetical protein
MTSARRGSLIAATWLIGLGVVFLVRQALDLPWGQAWPLFVILVGVASFVSTIFEPHGGTPRIWSFTWPILWIAVGTVLFLSTTGRLGTGPLELISEYWPWLLVGLGVWFLIGAIIPGGRALTEELAIPLGGVPSAAVRIRFGAGTLTTHAAAPGNLVDGTFRGGVEHRPDGPGRLELSQDTTYGMPWLDRESSWDVGLTSEVPLDLRLEAGASKTVLDLRDTRVRSLELQTGASETRVLLPRAAGVTTVKAEAGAASLTLEVPSGVAARIRSRMALGSSSIDETRFPRVGDIYQSVDYGTAENRVDLDLQGGVGSVRVIGGA